MGLGAGSVLAMPLLWLLKKKGKRDLEISLSSSQIQRKKIVLFGLLKKKPFHLT